MHKVLLIEDNPGDARLIREMLAEEPEAPFALHCAERLAHGLEQLSAGETVLVLLDLSLPDSFGLETFAKVYAHSPTVPIIVLTGNDDQTVALSAVKGGAQDYLVKQGSEAFISTPEQVTALIKADVAKYARIIKEAGIKAEM